MCGRGGGRRGDRGERIEIGAGMDDWRASSPSDSSSSEETTIRRRRVVVHFRWYTGSSGCESGETSIAAGFTRFFRGFCTLAPFLLRFDRDGEGDVVIGLTWAPVFETLLSFVKIWPLSSRRIISTSTTGDRGCFVEGIATCPGSTLIDTVGSLMANGRRADARPSMDFGLTFFLFVDLLAVSDEEWFGITGVGGGEVSDIESLGVMVVTGGEKDVLSLPRL